MNWLSKRETCKNLEEKGKGDPQKIEKENKYKEHEANQSKGEERRGKEKRVKQSKGKVRKGKEKNIK